LGVESSYKIACRWCLTLSMFWTGRLYVGWYWFIWATARLLSYPLRAAVWRVIFRSNSSSASAFSSICADWMKMTTTTEKSSDRLKRTGPASTGRIHRGWKIAIKSTEATFMLFNSNGRGGDCARGLAQIILAAAVPCEPFPSHWPNCDNCNHKCLDELCCKVCQITLCTHCRKRGIECGCAHTDVRRLLFSAQLSTATSRNLLLPWESVQFVVNFGRHGLIPVFQAVLEWTDPVPMVVRASEAVEVTANTSGTVSITSRPFNQLRGSAEGRDEKDMLLRAIHVRAWMNLTFLNPQASCAGLLLEGIDDDSMRSFAKRSCCVRWPMGVPQAFQTKLWSVVFRKARARRINATQGPRELFLIVNDETAKHLADQPFHLPDLAVVLAESR
jgi:hypothetical protein